jgi:hypothetical protein
MELPTQQRVNRCEVERELAADKTILWGLAI